MDCPEDVASYIHRVGRTARFNASGKSLLFLTPSEEKMVERLQEARIPVKVTKVIDPVLLNFLDSLLSVVENVFDMKDFDQHRQTVTSCRRFLDSWLLC